MSDFEKARQIVLILLGAFYAISAVVKFFIPVEQVVIEQFVNIVFALLSAIFPAAAVYVGYRNVQSIKASARRK